jgi:hypothetical protein
MEGLDARSRRSSRNVEHPGSMTPRLSARGGADEDGLSLAQLAEGVAGLSSQADRVAQQRGEGTRSTLDSMEEMSKSLAAAMNSRKVSVAEARRRAGVAPGGGARPDPVSDTDLDEAARAMVDAWLEPRGLAQYGERIIFAFKEAEYRPHEWTHTLDSMGPDELREFIAAVEKSPAPNEGDVEGGRARRRSRGGSVPAAGTASDSLSGTLAEVARISGPPKAGRRAGGAVAGRGGRRPSGDSPGSEIKPGKVGRRAGQGMEAVPRAAAGSGRESGGRSGPRAGRRAAAAAATAAANRGRRAAAMAGQAR